MPRFPNFPDMIPVEEIREGMVVQARFTNSGRYYYFHGPVLRVNSASARIQFDPGLPNNLDPMPQGYRPWTVFSIYTEMGFKRWSANNGIFRMGAGI